MSRTVTQFHKAQPEGNDQTVGNIDRRSPKSRLAVSGHAWRRFSESASVDEHVFQRHPRIQVLDLEISAQIGVGLWRVEGHGSEPSGQVAFECRTQRPTEQNQSLLMPRARPISRRRNQHVLVQMFLCEMDEF
jgi:hypothetical protein